VDKLTRLCCQSVANVSQHIQVLLGARMVLRSKEGTFARCRFAAPEVGEFYRSLRVLTESQVVHLEKARKHLVAKLNEAVPGGREERVRRVRTGDAFVTEVRPAEHYGAGHLPGACSIPAAELESRLA
jgi:hypothetical protein